MELVKEVEEEPNTNSIFEIDDKYYRWCAKNYENKVLGVKEIKLNAEPEELDEDDFTCPYCNSIYHDAWEMSENEDTIECGNCGSKIEYERNYKVTYTVSPVKRADIVKL